MKRQRYDEARAAVVGEFRTYLAAVQLHDLPADVEAQPESLVASLEPFGSHDLLLWMRNVGQRTSSARACLHRVLGAALVFVAMFALAAPTEARTADRVAAGHTAECLPSVGPGIAPPPSVPSGIDGFHAAWYGQSGYPTLCPGQRHTATVAYYNSGSRGWRLGSMGEVAYLGTWGPEPGQDRATPLGGDGAVGSPATGWPRYNRVAVQPAPWIGPQQVAWFQFTVIAPAIPGTYRLSIRPLIEGAQWMEDYGVFWYVTVAGSAPAGSLAPLPARWPSRSLEIGSTDDSDASALRANAPLAFRYTYLAGGANTGQGWATWNPGGQFVTSYIQDSVRNGLTPVFSYYMIRQSAPGNALGETDGVLSNLRNSATMASYYTDLKLFFQRAGALANTTVVFHHEPDLWGYIQQRFGDSAVSAVAQVAATGMSELAGLPDNAAGVAQAVVRLRDLYAPNVLLGYHLSVWGTNVDPLYSKPTDSEIDALADRSASFFSSLHARWDIAFAEFSDRDAGFSRYQEGDALAWWFADDFERNVRYLGRFSLLAQTRIVMWQIPLGNTKMRAMNNTWDHYQDNKVEWLFDDPGRANLSGYVRAGVAAFLFGRGGAGATCACDAAGDGVTNPAPIGTNTRISLSADDDGGYFRERAAAYYASGALELP